MSDDEYARELVEDWHLIAGRIREAEAGGLNADGLYRELEHTNELMRRAGVEWRPL